MVTDLVPSYPLGAIAGVTKWHYNDKVVLWKLRHLGDTSTGVITA